MSEEEFYIQREEDGEVSAKYSPAKISPSDGAEDSLVGNEEAVSVSEVQDSGVSTAQLLENETGVENVSRTENTSESGQDTDPPSNRSDTESISFGEPSSASTPVRRDAGVVSTVVSDKTPLLKDRSSTTDSCISVRTEEDNDGTSNVSCGCGYSDPRECPEHGPMNNIWIVPQSERRESLMLPGAIRVPIVGHETMEARAKFTVFKIHVMVEDDDVGWFLFRRYSDFVHLNDQLKILFPNFRLALPPKRWFRSNFDPEFLEERQIGLQAFLDNITGHRDICTSKPVRDFFCFDEPPGPHDSLEESRAQCENMEETVYHLRKELTDKNTELELVREELELYKNQVQLLTTRLSELNRMNSLERSGSEKRRLLAGGGQYDIDALFGSGDILLTKKLDPDVTELKTSDVENDDCASTKEA